MRSQRAEFLLNQRLESNEEEQAWLAKFPPPNLDQEYLVTHHVYKTRVLTRSVGVYRDVFGEKGWYIRTVDGYYEHLTRIVSWMVILPLNEGSIGPQASEDSAVLHVGMESIQARTIDAAIELLHQAAKSAEEAIPLAQVVERPARDGTAGKYHIFVTDALIAYTLGQIHGVLLERESQKGGQQNG